MSAITVLGCGAWATTVAQLAAENNHNVTLWCHREAYESVINTSHENSLSLPGVALSPRITATLDLEASLASSEACILGVPSVYLATVLPKLLGYHNPLLSLVKGVLNDEQWALSRYFWAHKSFDFSVLSGPNLAKDIAMGLPAASVVASQKESSAVFFQGLLSSRRFRIYTASDTIGVECGGILKNIMAIAAGICDGLGLGQNAKASLLTRGLKEMTIFGTYFGATIETFYGLSGLGDLMATCHSDQSRNWKIGFGLGQGKSVRDISLGSSVPEGVRTAQFVSQLAKKHGFEMPITLHINDIILQKISPQEALAALMHRELKSE
jgi:glycerol-3-phosphate dehydrogenase (NAD(P)+)